MPIFGQKKKTLSELEDDLEYKKTEHEIAEEDAAISELKARGQKWQDFSTNGKKSGFSLAGALAWLKSH